MVKNILMAPFRPPMNNWVLLASWIVTIVLFVVAIYMGGGEPLGLKALKEVSQPSQVSKVVEEYYNQSAARFGKPVIGIVEESAENGTWFWWKLWLASFIWAILFIPIAFWDEVAAAWHKTMEAHEQRRVEIDLTMPMVDEKSNVQAGKTSAKFEPQLLTSWGRFKERFTASFSADMFTDFITSLGKRILGDRLARRFK
ncbi:MAG: hypothetical protein AAB724_02050 [Patescibacteria group bacterium]